MVPSCRSPESPLGVIVNYQSWLPLTENWIYTQAKHLPSWVTPYVVCGNTRNLDRFPMEHLFSYADLGRLERMGVLTRGAVRLGAKLGRRSALMAEVAYRYGARVVHSHFGYTGYHSAPAVRRLGLAHVVTFYGVDMSAMPIHDAGWLGRYRALFESVDKVLCEGPHMAAKVRQLGCPESKLQVQHLGVDLTTLPFRPRRWEPSEPLSVLIAASFREKKGITYAIQALGKVAATVPLEVTIIGDAGENPKSKKEKLRIREAVVRCGLESRVRFLGYQPHNVLLEEAYRHHVFLSPSVTASDGDSEGGLPVTLIEMAATGIPIVSTRHADIPEVIEHGVGGLLAEERDVDGLVGHLRWLTDHPDAWAALTRAARMHVETKFEITRQCERLASIYREVTGSSSPRHGLALEG